MVKIFPIALLIAAVLKGWQLLTEPVANNDIWSYRPFLILSVEFELALAIWLLSGLFKKAAWLATLLCFSAFSAITLYKGITGAESCGCFGPVHVNPWITLFAIELPAVIALLIFRPSGFNIRKPLELFRPFPSARYFAGLVFHSTVILTVTTLVLLSEKPTKNTAKYEVLEPKNWIGKNLPIYEYIDSESPLDTKQSIILFYHADCPGCRRLIPKFESIARHNSTNYDAPETAMVEVPPYSFTPINRNSPCILGLLARTKKWFLETPVVILMLDGNVMEVWEGNKLDHDDKVEQFISRVGYFFNLDFKTFRSNNKW